jgi:hypothetical protein
MLSDLIAVAASAVVGSAGEEVYQSLSVGFFG